MTKREIGVLLHQHYRHDQRTNVILLLEDIRNYCDITRIDFDDCDYLAEDGYRGSQRARDNYGPRNEAGDFLLAHYYQRAADRKGVI